MYYLNTYCKVLFVRIPVGKESRKLPGFAILAFMVSYVLEMASAIGFYLF